jgi:UDP-N-acetylmuramate dehydrogenase
MAINVQKQVDLAAKTTFNVGGKASHYLAASSEGELLEGLWWAHRQGLAVEVLGGGSNCLVADSGLDALVLQPALKSRKVERGSELWSIEVGAGEIWDDFVAWSVAEGLCGIESLSGIPGWVGAAPMQNIGAYGQEVSSVVEAVRVIKRDRGEALWLPAKALGFSYRMSNFKGAWRDHYIISAVRFSLRRGRPDAARYAELAKRLGGEADSPEQVRAAVLELRAGKSMLYDLSDPNHRSAGSFFLNPELDDLGLAMLRQRAEFAGLDTREMPVWAQDSGHKLSAAWLMQHAGLSKGLVQGRAGLSSNHCLALINRGSAEAGDLLSLAAFARSRVNEVFGLQLCPEPVFLGFPCDVDELLAKYA